MEESNTYSIYQKKYEENNKIEKLKEAIRTEGDTVAFIKLQEIYFNSGKKKEFLYYSIYMANNFNYNKAFFINYLILYTDIINDKNIKSNMLANYYLLKAYEGGHKHSKNSVKIRFKDEKIPTSKEYWNLIYNGNSTD